MKLLKLFKKPKGLEPLPTFKLTTFEDVAPASTLLFYGSPGNKWTERAASNIFGHPYNPPAFHAALYLSDGEYLNVGKFKTIDNIYDTIVKGAFSTRRIDVIEYQMPKKARTAIVKAGHKDISKAKVGFQFPDYAITDYLRFGLPFLKASKKDFCSENVVENMEAQGVEVSHEKAVDTAPWDLLEYALNHPETCDIYTAFVGEKFDERMGR
jgi:hypothetical protein